MNKLIIKPLKYRVLSILLILLIAVSLTASPTYASDTSNTSRRVQILNSLERYIYDQLLIQVKEIAEGKKADAFVSIDFTSKINKTQFTAKDLGVSTLLGSNGKYTEEVTSLAAKKAIGSLDTDKIVNAMLRDAPFELYWFDKTLGCLQNVHSGVSGTNQKIGVTSARVDFYFAVSGDYSSSGARGTYNVNTSKTRTSAKVMTKATAIVKEAAGKSDYDKLDHYRETICDLVAYNSSVASDPSKSAMYGDPYQLIYVFDSITTNRVTCEGYSKAFKLLCDLTDFDSPEIACYIVTGAMRGGTGAGPHMWNVVRMEDGYNYMVDITNCDMNTIGYPNQLFLKGDSGGSADRYAVGTMDGTIAYQYDDETKRLFSSAERTIHIVPYVKPPHVHQFGAWTKINEHQHRRVCADDSSHSEVALHEWDEGRVITEATTQSEGTMIYTCTVCKATKREAIPKVAPKQIWYRLAGSGRYDTMKAIVDEGFSKTGGTVIVATGSGFKDALSASGLAGLFDAPVVLTDGSSLSSQARTVLYRLKPSRIYVAGGKAAISNTVVNQIQSLTKVTPKRLYGQTSSGTSAALASEGKGKWKGSIAVIATNKSYKDALSVAPIAYAKGYPILLADNGKSLSSDVIKTLKSIGIKQVIIVGGTAAVEPKVETQLKQAGITIKTRLWGNRGVDTSKAIAQWGLNNGLTADKMGVATSQNYPDALSGAALCGHNKSVLVLADDKALDNTSFPKSYKNDIKKGYVFGGEFAVGSKTLAALEASVK